ncbi:MAG: hypothetical protein ACLUD2_21595 [Clostridium sp.]
MKKKHVSLLLAAAMAASVISGCGNSANNSAAETEKTETTAAAATSAAEETTAVEAAGDTREKRGRRSRHRDSRVTLYREAETLTTAGKALMCGKLSQRNNGGVIESVARQILGAQR